MTNNEKKEFILKAHKLFMEYDPYNEKLSLEEMIKKEQEYADKYFSDFYSFIPEVFYKFRSGKLEDYENFENEIAWFSHPEDFNDTSDSTINNDIENELKDLENDLMPHIIKLSTALIKATIKKYGVQADEKEINNIYGLFNKDGKINQVKTRIYLKRKVPDKVADQLIYRLNSNMADEHYTKVYDSVRGYLNTYLDFNKRSRKETLVYSLTEHVTEAMWTHYANGMKGFCIEYSFPKETFLGQRMLLNIFPVYYGEKENIKFFDLMVKGLNSLKQKYGICYEDYATLFLSAYTKDQSYSFENEWRITFSKRFGGNKQSFPFIKAVYLGERIDDDGKERILDAARQKGVPVYQRKYNKTLSQITLVRIDND